MRRRRATGRRSSFATACRGTVEPCVKSAVQARSLARTADFAGRGWPWSGRDAASARAGRCPPNRVIKASGIDAKALRRNEKGAFGQGKTGPCAVV